MKAFLPALLLLSVLVRRGMAAPSPNDAEAHWKRVLTRIHVGMRRARVEALLGGKDYALDSSADPKLEAKLGKKGHTAIYLLDGDWCTAVTFDWSGFTLRNNPNILMHLPDHKVIAPPQLLHRGGKLEEKIQQERTEHPNA